MKTQNKFINKDDYMLFQNNMSAFEESRDDKSVSTILMKSVIVFLYIIFIIISIIFLYIIYIKSRFIVLALYIFLVLSFLKYYVKIAYVMSKFIENNLLFKI
jgi:hypothetical protein